MRARRNQRAGFTLIELLLALSIFTLVTAMSAAAFWTVMKAWTRGGELLEQLNYGEFAMEQLVTALRGAAWFPSKPEAFGFWLDPRGGTSRTAANEISWVTSGTAFLPPDSPFQHGLHRLSVTVEGSGDKRGLVVKAWPHLAEEEDRRNVDSWLVAPAVDGLCCEWYDFEDERWSQDWEETNSLPKLVRVTLTMRKRKDFDENLELQRLVELEVAPDLPGRESRSRSRSPARDARRNTPENTAAGSAGSAAPRGAAGAPPRQTVPTVGRTDGRTLKVESGPRGGGR